MLEIVSLLLEAENDVDSQERLAAVSAALATLVSSPAEPSYQRAFAASLDEFRSSLDQLRHRFQPAQVKILDEIGANKFFFTDLAGDIANWISRNPATPAVAQENLSKLVKDRAAFLSELEQLTTSLVAVGIETNGLKPSEAEIGFQLPRELFDNQLEKLIDELRVIRRVIRAFSEAATGSAQPIEVRQISTSDPLFFFGLDPFTIGLIGGAVAWALNTWKQVEEIRKIRAETAKIDALKNEPINEIFESSIKKTIEASIEAKTGELVGAITGKDARKNEQRTDLKWALESILARVERGMTVEIRMLPPVQKSPEASDSKTQRQFDDLEQIADQLSFPKVAGDPVLALPPVEPEKPRRKEASASG